MAGMRRLRGNPSIPAIGLLVVVVAAPIVNAQKAQPLPGEAHIQRAEAAIKQREMLVAESEYRFAAAAALVALGNLWMSEAKWDDALKAFSEASANLTNPQQPLLSVASIYLQQEKPEQAESLLRQLISDPVQADPAVTRLLVTSYAAQRRYPEALAQIGEARRAAPEDPELAYLEASIALQASQPEIATKAFADLKRLRPGAAAHVLVGRTLRDFGRYDEAEHELKQALKLDPKVRRAHYYLGTIAVLRDATEGVATAIAEFRRELEIAPGDYLSSLNAGIALYVDRQFEAALPLLTTAAAAQLDPAALYYLGQVEFQTGNTAGALETLRKYVGAEREDASTISQLGNAHYVIARALRSSGQEQEASVHFVRANELKSRLANTSQDRLQQYLAGESGQAGMGTQPGGSWKVAAEPLPKTVDTERLRGALSEIAARAYFNLGVMLSQRERYLAAAGLFHRAMSWQPEFPGGDYALGVARVRAGQNERAIEPLRHALERDPNNGELRQLLAMACFNAQKYECSAQLLEGAPLVANDPSLIYALGVSLVRSGRPQAGAQVFSRMITEHAGSAELYVLLGEAHSQQGDFDNALAQFNKAIELDPRVPNAHTSAGLLHLRVGNLHDAVRHFRAELQLRPKDARTRYHLAYALQLQGNSEEAMQHLRETLRLDPGSADARYLLGKALLDGGDATAAVEQLQASIRLAPGDARAHYQLGRAYQRLGRQEDAQRQFALYQELKPKERNP